MVSEFYMVADSWARGYNSLAPVQHGQRVLYGRGQLGERVQQPSTSATWSASSIWSRTAGREGATAYSTSATNYLVIEIDLEAYRAIARHGTLDSRHGCLHSGV